MINPTCLHWFVIRRFRLV